MFNYMQQELNDFNVLTFSHFSIVADNETIYFILKK